MWGTHTHTLQARTLIELNIKELTNIVGNQKMQLSRKYSCSLYGSIYLSQRAINASSSFKKNSAISLKNQRPPELYYKGWRSDLANCYDLPAPAAYSSKEKTTHWNVFLLLHRLLLRLFFFLFVFPLFDSLNIMRSSTLIKRGVAKVVRCFKKS